VVAFTALDTLESVKGLSEIGTGFRKLHDIHRSRRSVDRAARKSGNDRVGQRAANVTVYAYA